MTNTEDYWPNLTFIEADRQYLTNTEDERQYLTNNGVYRQYFTHTEDDRLIKFLKAKFVQIEF